MSFDDTNRPTGGDSDGPTVSEKLCVHCWRTKPAEGFNRQTKASDGLQSWCRSCQKENAAKVKAEKEAEKLSKEELTRARRSAAQKERRAKERAEALEAPKKVVRVVHKSASDPVNSPEHYKTGGIECIDAMIQVFGIDAVRTYARINAFKYQWRHRYKGKPEEDLAKAAWYTRFADGDDPRKGGDR